MSEHYGDNKGHEVPNMPKYDCLYSPDELVAMGLKMERFHYAFSLWTNGTNYVFKHYVPSDERPNARFGLETILITNK